MDRKDQCKLRGRCDRRSTVPRLHQLEKNPGKRANHSERIVRGAAKDVKMERRRPVQWYQMSWAGIGDAGTAGSWCWDRSGKRACGSGRKLVQSVGGQGVPLSERAGGGGQIYQDKVERFNLEFV